MMADDYDDSSSSGEEIKARGRHANVPVIPTFDLNVALKALSEDNAQLSHILEQEEQNLRKSRQKIVSSSRKNFILERELNEIDEKIKLLVKNRITVQEVMMSSNTEASNEKSSDDQNFLKTKRTLYEDMFYLLQTRPQYFAHAARTLQAKEIPSFVQTVVFDMYGDQYDTREERLLLSLFRIALQQELHHAVDKGSLLRANTAITQMLSAYARRGQGLSILKDILEEPLKNITSRKDLNLEINPTKVYSQMITDYESSTGQTSPLNKNITDEQAAQNVEVQKIIAQRSRELLNLADIILKRIIDGVESIPYGMRWICKQLGELSRNKFPDADRYQIGSLMGGYIYLRFFNPVIVTPDTVGFVQTKPSRVMRRNLILIAKVLQNLSNGLLFGEKETYMKGLNSFIEERMDPLQDYFDQLVNVDELDDVSQVDKYLEHTNSRSSMVQLSLNQIILIHSILQKNIDKLAPDAADPIRDLIRRLGPPPEEVKKEENRVVALQLADRRKERMSTKFSAADIVSSKPTINPLTVQAKNLLLAVLKRLPIATNQSQLLPFLEDEKRRAIARGNSSLADNLTNVISMLCTLDNMTLLPKGVTPHDTFNQFLWGFAQESVSKAGRVKLLEKRSAIVNQALKSIENHHSYLQSRLELYKIYLDNVRQGQSQQQLMNKPNNTKMKIITPSKPAAPKIAKFTHFQLEEMGVVTRTNADVKKAVLKKCYYEFTQSSAGKFKVELHLNKGIDIKLLNKPIELALEELLRMQEHGELMMDIDYVTLNVNLLIHLLNTHFMGQK